MFSWNRVLSLAALMGLAVVLSIGAGCATRSQAIYTRDEKGQIVQHKRYAKDVAVDWIHRFSSCAYRPAAEKDFAVSLSPHQETLLSELGRPDMIRRPFRTRTHELVEEWVYLEKHHVAQFVEGLLAYEGPLTDYEQVLIRNGYPDHATEAQRQGGFRFFFWSYKDSFFGASTEVCLSGDKIVYHESHK